MEAEGLINQKLESINVVVEFSDKAKKDLYSFDKGIQSFIMALIIKCGQKNPMYRPEGLGKRLEGDLSDFCKIKHRKSGIRVIYKPQKNGKILMIIIAIGPKKDDIYKRASQRLVEFYNEYS